MKLVYNETDLAKLVVADAKVRLNKECKGKVDITLDGVVGIKLNGVDQVMTLTLDTANWG